MCGDPSDEMDHRLAIEVARALGPEAMLRAFTPENLRWLCRGCHRHKTRQGPTAGEVSSRPARWTGTAREECCVSTANGCSRFCCRAAWSLLRGTEGFSCRATTQRWRIRQPVNTKYCAGRQSGRTYFSAQLPQSRCDQRYLGISERKPDIATAIVLFPCDAALDESQVCD